MCGRYSIYDVLELQERFHLKKSASIKPVYNASPAMMLPIITDETPSELTVAKWGLVPFWAKAENTGYKMINAKAETIMEKTTFKHARHCLVPANNFFEWKKTAAGKIPFLVKTKDKIFSFAGLYETTEIENRKIISYTIITTKSNKEISKVHDRMPIILKKEDEKVWLKSSGIPAPEDNLVVYQVSDKINNTRYQGNDVINPVTTLSGF